MADDLPPPQDLESTEVDPASSTALDDHIGPYHLLQRIGEGGMGEVWLAEQQEPIRRKVALKIIKRGMDTKRVVARFEAERQALALMDHPAVAKVFDAGTTPRGRPYFVMEYVKGLPITEYCDRRRLNNSERMELFQQVCEGAQHAHQKAIIHRDLKPSNVLVTEQDGRRQPKIIDFGVAKATAQKLTEKTMFTELGVLIGTPEYMSPEQAELTGEDVDTRTDVYSLGVILYELLVGALPFDPKELRSGGFEGIRKKIREEEPHRPSTRLSTLGDQSRESAKCRRVDLATLQRQLRGDLDWITMRALEKDRSRRYGSPMDLAADVARHLRHEPVLASPPSVGYRARKFVRRHTVGVGTAAAGMLVLVAFATTMAVQANRIAAERDRANAEAERANREAGAKSQVAEFLQELFTVSDPGESRGNSITARELLDKGAEKIQQLEDELTRAGLMATMGYVYLRLGLAREAEPLVEQAVVEHKRLLGTEHSSTLRTMNFLGHLYDAQGRVDEAEALYTELLAGSRRLHGDDHRFTLGIMDNLAMKYRIQGRFDEAEELHLQAFNARKRLFGDDHPDTISSMDFLGLCYQSQRRYDEAESFYLEAIEARRRVEGDDHYRMFDSMSNLASMYTIQKRYDEAEALYLETLEGRRHIFEDDHPSILTTMSGLGNLYKAQGRYDEAEEMHLRTLAARRANLGDDHTATLWSKESLANVYRAEGRYADAERLYAEALEARERTLGEHHETALRLKRHLARVYRRQERYREAWSVYRKLLEGERLTLGEEKPATLRSMRDLAEELGQAGDPVDAEDLLREVLVITRRVQGESHEDTLRAMDDLAASLGFQGRIDEAESLLLEILDARRHAFGDAHVSMALTLYNLACVAGVRGDREKAMDWLRRAVDVGYADVDTMTRDSTLDLIHGPAFDALVERVRQKAAG